MKSTSYITSSCHTIKEIAKRKFYFSVTVIPEPFEIMAEFLAASETTNICKQHCWLGQLLCQKCV
jgi:hypothetical protein